MTGLTGAGSRAGVDAVAGGVRPGVVLAEGSFSGMGGMTDDPLEGSDIFGSCACRHAETSVCLWQQSILTQPLMHRCIPFQAHLPKMADALQTSPCYAGLLAHHLKNAFEESMRTDRRPGVHLCPGLQQMLVDWLLRDDLVMA